MTKVTVPAPIATESRTCFGIEWYASEADALARAAVVKSEGHSYNGGWFDGMACGRDHSFDRTVQDQKQFAVTTS